MRSRKGQSAVKRTADTRRPARTGTPDTRQRSVSDARGAKELPVRIGHGINAFDDITVFSFNITDRKETQKWNHCFRLLWI